MWVLRLPYPSAQPIFRSRQHFDTADKNYINCKQFDTSIWGLNVFFCPNNTPTFSCVSHHGIYLANHVRCVIDSRPVQKLATEPVYTYEHKSKLKHISLNLSHKGEEFPSNRVLVKCSWNRYVQFRYLKELSSNDESHDSVLFSASSKTTAVLS